MKSKRGVWQAVYILRIKPKRLDYEGAESGGRGGHFYLFLKWNIFSVVSHQRLAANINIHATILSYNFSNFQSSRKWLIYPYPNYILLLLLDSIALKALESNIQKYVSALVVLLSWCILNALHAYFIYQLKLRSLRFLHQSLQYIIQCAQT